MFLHGTSRINERGHLEIGGCDTTELAARFGTPLYVMDESLIRQRCREYMDAFRATGLRFQVAYASKAFCVMAMCRIVDEEGLSLDVVSDGELYTALQAGFPPNASTSTATTRLRRRSIWHWMPGSAVSSSTISSNSICSMRSPEKGKTSEHLAAHHPWGGGAYA